MLVTRLAAEPVKQAQWLPSTAFKSKGRAPSPDVPPLEPKRVPSENGQAMHAKKDHHPVDKSCPGLTSMTSSSSSSFKATDSDPSLHPVLAEPLEVAVVHPALHSRSRHKLRIEAARDNWKRLLVNITPPSGPKVFCHSSYTADIARCHECVTEAIAWQAASRQAKKCRSAEAIFEKDQCAAECEDSRSRKPTVAVDQENANIASGSIHITRHQVLVT